MVQFTALTSHRSPSPNIGISEFFPSLKRGINEYFVQDLERKHKRGDQEEASQ